MYFIDHSNESLFLVSTGILLCLGGWYFFRFSTLFIGTLLGAALGYKLGFIILPWLGQHLAAPWPSVVLLAITALAAGGGAWLVKSAVKVFLFGAGFMVGMAVFQMAVRLPLPDNIAALASPVVADISLLSLVGGTLFGIIFVFYERACIILYTAVAGAFLVSAGFGNQSFVFFTMLALGLFVQLWLARGCNISKPGLRRQQTVEAG